MAGATPSTVNSDGEARITEIRSGTGSPVNMRSVRAKIAVSSSPGTCVRSSR
jgi:hypothetical protein